MSTKHTSRSAGNGDPIVFRSVDSLGTLERLSFWLTLLVRGNTSTTVKTSTVRSCSVRRTCGVESLRRKLHFVAKIEQAIFLLLAYICRYKNCQTFGHQLSPMSRKCSFRIWLHPHCHFLENEMCSLAFTSYVSDSTCKIVWK